MLARAQYIAQERVILKHYLRDNGIHYEKNESTESLRTKVEQTFKMSIQAESDRRIDSGGIL
jgi:hypothetical protein